MITIDVFFGKLCAQLLNGRYKSWLYCVVLFESSNGFVNELEINSFVVLGVQE